MLKNLMARLKTETKPSTQEPQHDTSVKANDFTINSQPINLSNHKIGEISSIYYIPHYIPMPKQTEILGLVDSLPENDWVQLPHAKRRLQKLGGDVSDQGLTNIVPLPEFMRKLADKLVIDKMIDKIPNHVLLNDYGSSSGIMPHTDGPLYYPRVCVLSLGSGCILKFFTNYQEYKNGNQACALYCEQGSLYIFTETAYNDYLHAIDDTAADEVLVALKTESDTVTCIEAASVANYQDLDCLKGLIGQTVQSLIERRLIAKVEQNDRYNYMAFFPRSRRVSLTIRYVPEAK